MVHLICFLYNRLLKIHLCVKVVSFFYLHSFDYITLIKSLTFDKLLSSFYLFYYLQVRRLRRAPATRSHIGIPIARLLLFYFLFVLNSCAKESGSYTFKGHVIDRLGLPIANANVVLYTGNTWPFDRTQVAKTKTDNKGDFTVRFDAKDTAYIETSVGAESYYPILYSSVGHIQNGTIVDTPVLYKLATVKINFKNQTPMSGSDNFSVQHYHEYFGDGFTTFIERKLITGTYDSQLRHYIGNNVEGYELTKTMGDTTTIILWSFRKNNVNYHEMDTIIIPGGTQGNYQINF